MQGFEQKKREILTRISILDVIAEHVTLKRSGQRWVGLCPFHTEKTPSFTVRPEHGTFKCFGCGKGGDLFSFVQYRENVPFMEAMQILGDRAGVDLSRGDGGESRGPSRAGLARANAWASGFFRSQLLDDRLGHSARAYVRSRGISDETAERFGLGLATGGDRRLTEAASQAGLGLPLLVEADLVRRGDRGGEYETFRERLIFPIRDATGRVVGFGGRTLADDRAKYLNTRQTVLFDKGRGLYGIDLARDAITRCGRANVVEGYTDCLAAHQAGFLETVATLGTALTEAQVDLLRRYADQIVLLFDSDKAGEAAADRAIHVALPRCVTVRLARIPDAKDPSEFLAQASSEAFSDLLNGAVDALEFKWSKTRERFQQDAPGTARREAILDFLRVVAGAVETAAIDAIQRGLLVNQVAHLLQMERSDVDRLLRRLRSKPAQPRASSGEPTAETHKAVPRDGEQAAWGQVLEVLLNDPAVLDPAEGVPDVDRIADERDRRIASVVLERMGVLDRKEPLTPVGEPGSFSLCDVLACFREPSDVDRIRELAQRGAERGNYRATLRVALQRIRQAPGHDQTERDRRAYLDTSVQEGNTENTTDSVTNLDAALRAHRGFTPRRRIRQTIGPRE